MKKLLSAILASTMICASAIGFAGCGGSENTGSQASSETTEGKELHMATNAAFEPYEYVEGGKVVGIDAEIAEAICDKLGYTLVIDDMDFDSIITAVTSGKADFGMAGMTVTDERKQSVDFTDSYTNAIQVIIVNEDEDKVSGADDLKTAVIGVQLGTTGDIYVSDFEETGAKIERFNKGADAVLALTQGKVDAVVIDNQPAKAFVAQNEGTKILEEPFENEEYAICLAKGSELTEKFNGALRELKADGTVDSIIKKYISE
ncbi:MAG: basic amino acid ABC transporter substrate-binding protein [Ruminococcus sp.]|nr:basic amino acid ABC transporter substrate-binding protein [Ruminococcus sp.]